MLLFCQNCDLPNLKDDSRLVFNLLFMFVCEVRGKISLFFLSVLRGLRASAREFYGNSPVLLCGIFFRHPSDKLAFFVKLPLINKQVPDKIGYR